MDQGAVHKLSMLRAALTIAFAAAVLMLTAVRADATVTSIASTGQATSVSAQGAVLNGVVDPAVSGMDWLFQYSPSSTFATGVVSTRPVSVSKGLHAVSLSVSGLRPATTYYVRIGLLKPPAALSTALLASPTRFTTLAPAHLGHATLITQSLRLSGSSTVAELGCEGSGRALCVTSVELTASGAHGGTLVCGAARAGAWAPARMSVKIPLSRACRQRLAKARGHRIFVELKAVFLGGQSAIRRRLRLTG